MDSPNSFIKDPNATLDYSIDWNKWMPDGDSISNVVWTVPPGLVEVSNSATVDMATVWLSSGTVGQSYEVGCHITTAGNRQDDRTITITVRNK